MAYFFHSGFRPNLPPLSRQQLFVSRSLFVILYSLFFFRHSFFVILFSSFFFRHSFFVILFSSFFFHGWLSNRAQQSIMESMDDNIWEYPFGDLDDDDDLFFHKPDNPELDTGLN
jgi:hypothetical protein